MLNAREHNLKDLSVDIPRNELTVVTGLSGSGKSTLAFDIVFNEGQRRYLESLNAYARSIVQPSGRADVDAVLGIPPTVAIEQCTSRGGRKSTVSTMTELYHFLRPPEGRSVGIAYFRERGFSDATIRKFGLGYCPAAGDAFTRQALADGYKEQFLVGTGLTIKRETGGYYDRFCGRVMFPIHSIGGRVTAFGGRTMRTDKKVAKYLNSPESEIYHKSDVLYGLYHAKRAIVQQDCCILVEGYTDVIQMHQSGVENVVASSGTSLTEGQIRLIGRFTRNVTVIYDGDSAGIKASVRGIDMLLREGLNVRVVLLPDGDDPDSFARKRNATELQEFILKHEEDFISFKTRLLMSDAGNDPLRKAALVTDIVQSISVIPDAITRSVYTRECSRQMEIDEQVLLREIALRRLERSAGGEAKEFVRRQELIRRRSEGPDSLPTTVEAGSGIDELERELVKYLVKYGEQNFEYVEGKQVVELNVAEVIIADLDKNGIRMKNPAYRKIYDEYKRMRATGEPGEIPS